MDFNMMVLFDIIIGILGLTLIVKGIKGTKKREVDPMLVPAEEMMKCMDKAAFADYLMPKTTIFGFYCLIFAVEAICYDMNYLAIPKAVNSLFLILFVVVWFMFTYFLKKGKSKFIK